MPRDGILKRRAVNTAFFLPVFLFVFNDEMRDERASIASGSRLETSAKAEASVLINGVGNLQLEKRTRVVLSYTERETSVILENGCATLWVEPGMKGSLKAKTEEKTIENNKRKNSIEICAEKGAGGVLLWSALGAGGLAALAGGTAMSEKTAKDEVILLGGAVVSASNLRDLGR